MISIPKLSRDTIIVKINNDPEWIKKFREQENERYKVPTKPWKYTLSRGDTTVVAPVCKKIPPKGSKPRVHYLLKSTRPAFITILSLVRDAAWYKLNNTFVYF